MEQKITNQLLTEVLEEIRNRPSKTASPSVYNPTLHFTVESERETNQKIPEGVYTKNRISTNGKEFTRETHALLFQVVDWLEINSNSRNLSSRKLATEFENTTKTSVSHVWAAIAKNYWIVNGS